MNAASVACEYWRDTLSPRNVNTIEFRVKRAFEIDGSRYVEAGDKLKVWPQGETYLNINGRLTAFTADDISAWIAAELIVPW
jgi:hypothetical protein